MKNILKSLALLAHCVAYMAFTLFYITFFVVVLIPMFGLVDRDLAQEISKAFAGSAKRKRERLIARVEKLEGEFNR
jgi:hypothetical protein